MADFDAQAQQGLEDFQAESAQTTRRLQNQTRHRVISCSPHQNNAPQFNIYLSLPIHDQLPDLFFEEAIRSTSSLDTIQPTALSNPSPPAQPHVY